MQSSTTVLTKRFTSHVFLTSHVFSSFPTIAAVVNGKVVQYNNDCNAKDVYTFLTQLPSVNIEAVATMKQANNFLKSSCSKGNGVCLILFTENPSKQDPLILKTIAYSHRSVSSSKNSSGREQKFMSVGAVYVKPGQKESERGEGIAIAEEFGVKTFPTALIVCGNEGKTVSEKYEGTIKDFDGLEKFISKYIGKPNQCRALAAAINEKKKNSQKLIDSVKGLSKAQLIKKKIGELRTIIEALGINSKSSLLEKDDFVNAIIHHLDRSKSKVEL